MPRSSRSRSRSGSRSRSRSRSRSVSASKRIKNLDDVLRRRLEFMRMNPGNTASKQQYNDYMEYMGKSLLAQRKNGRNKTHKMIEKNQNAQRTLAMMHRKRRAFMSDPRTFIGESPVSGSPTRRRHLRFMSYY